MLIVEGFLAREAAAKQHAGVPTWRARYMAIWDNLALFPNDPNVGAYHGSDIPIVFGTFSDPGVGNGTVPEAEQKLSASYMDVWLTFAEVGTS
jgi:carboxylesterase type B